MGALLDAALWNARHGFRVFPVAAGANRPPLIKDFPHQATRDEQIIVGWWTRWPDANVGVATGEGLIVADIDVKNGKRGFDTFKSLGLPGDTFIVHTPSGGFHAYYRGEGRNSVEQIGEGLDVRGMGGYVVGAGSERPDGSYRTVGGDRPLRDAPEGLRGRPGPGADNGGQHRLPPPGVILDTPDALDRAEAWLKSSPPAIEGHGGDERTFKTAAQVKDLGISEFMAFELLAEHWNPRCEPPWDLEELAVKVSNAYQYGVRPPGTQTPQVDFAGAAEVRPPAPAKSVWTYADDDVSFDQRWLFHQLLETSGVALLVGESGSGKTFLATELARSVATGKPFFGTEPDVTGASLFLFAGSEGGGFGQRVRALQESQKLPIAWRSVWNLRDTATMQSLADDLANQKQVMLDRYGVPLRLVVLETLSASGLMEKENDNAQGAAAIEILGRIGAALDVLFVVSHHPPKGGEDPRGAGALRASADYVLFVGRDGRSPLRELILAKGRNVAERQVGAFTLIDVPLGTDSRGRPVGSLAVSMGAPQTRTQRTIKNLQGVMDAFDLADADMLQDGWLEKEDWQNVFISIDTSPDVSNRRRKFKSAFDQALRERYIETRISTDNVEVFRPRTIGGSDGGS